MGKMEDINEVISSCAKHLGYDSLKVKQSEAICAFVEGHDTFVSLPTVRKILKIAMLFYHLCSTDLKM